MPKTARKSFYAVRSGRVPGIYSTWDECKSQVDGFPKSRFKGFKTRQEAEAFMGGVVNVGTSTGGACTVPVTRIQQGMLNGLKDGGLESKRKSPSTVVSPTVISPTQFMGVSVPSPLTGQCNALDTLPVLPIYTDGSCLSNGSERARAGYGIYFGPSHPFNTSARLPGPIQTNNRAELLAVIRAIEIAPPNMHLVVHSDSMYMKQGIEQWMTGWKKRRWKTFKGTDVLNKDLWVRLEEAREGYRGRVTLKYVRGHAGVLGNEQADRLANVGAALPKVP
ncbi:hypothetical protein SpCBS45565_g08270 [Spizellomyces sp. 'palustris']|nr:hypothetical protein SpCBS45565_g08270 [Spizellomyces sp. 'palustris']